MSVILERLKVAAQTGERLEFAAVRETIHAEHQVATSTNERVMLLAIYHLFLNETEGYVAPENLSLFKESRLQDYRLLLIQEAMVGENVCTETLNAIVEREVNAGRMAPDDSLYATTVAAMAAPHYSRAELEAISAKNLKEASSAKPNRSSWRGLVGRVLGSE